MRRRVHIPQDNIYRKTFDHRTSGPYNEYTYDDLDRLTAVTYHDSDTEAFDIDDLGNRDGNQSMCKSVICEDCDCVHRKRFLTLMAVR